MPVKKEVAVEKAKSVKEDCDTMKILLDKVERIERLTIIVWSLSILTFMLTLFCLFK